MNPIYELNITWEVIWYSDDDEERKEYTDTTEYFYEDDDVSSLDDFFDKADDMLGEDRFKPEADISQYLEEGGDLEIEYVKMIPITMKYGETLTTMGNSSKTILKLNLLPNYFFDNK
jgi:hypothetical protein